VPDTFAPIAGYRRFGIPWPPRKENHCLMQKGHLWSPKGPTVAECRRPVSLDACGHTAPAQSCGCGLHAWMEAEEALRYYELTTIRGWVLASVMGWGRVLITRHREDVFRRGARGQTSPRLDEEIAA
jgi:hypothetical protein